MKVRGRLEFRDVGVGQWLLDTPKGVISLFGDIPKRLAGREVEVVGEKADGASIGMVSDTSVVVSSVVALD